MYAGTTHVWQVRTATFYKCTKQRIKVKTDAHNHSTDFWIHAKFQKRAKNRICLWFRSKLVNSVHSNYRLKCPLDENKLRWWRHWTTSFWRSRREILYREELELERERWRLRPGDLERDRLLTGERRRGERDLHFVGNVFKKSKKKFKGLQIIAIHF